MMKRAIACAVLLAGSRPALAASPGGELGLGLGGGLGVSGLSGKYYLGDPAVQVVFGGNNLTEEDSGLGLGVDYLFEQPDIAHGGSLDVAWNCGFGATIGTGTRSSIGASGVVGLELLFLPVPLDLVIEYRPGAQVLPDLTPDLINFTSHIRYYF